MPIIEAKAECDMCGMEIFGDLYCDECARHRRCDVTNCIFCHPPGNICSASTETVKHTGEHDKDGNPIFTCASYLEDVKK